MVVVVAMGFEVKGRPLLLYIIINIFLISFVCSSSSGVASKLKMDKAPKARAKYYAVCAYVMMVVVLRLCVS
jgi:hypothetical protein